MPIKRCDFNLIEIVLAMGVVLVGIVGIMGFLPVGQQANLNTRALSYSGDGADQLLHILAAQLKSDWSILTVFPDKEPPDIATPYPDAEHSKGQAGPITDGWTKVANTNELGSLWEKAYGTNTIYRIYQASTVNGTDVVDFDAMVRIWKSPTTVWKYESGSWSTLTDTTYSKRVQLNMELSWPAMLPYGVRKKAFYSIEVSRNGT